MGGRALSTGDLVFRIMNNDASFLRLGSAERKSLLPAGGDAEGFGVRAARRRFAFPSNTVA
jgi:hypothetical protein